MSNLKMQMQAADERLRAAAIAFRRAVLYEAQRRTEEAMIADHERMESAVACDCQACIAADELNEAAFEYAEFKERS